MRLDVPVVKQREESYHCQIACLLMVMQFYGDEISYDGLVEELQPYLLESGMHNQGAAIFLRKRGYNTFFAHHDLGVLTPDIENKTEKDLAQLEQQLAEIPENKENRYCREKLALDIEYIRVGGLYSTRLPTLGLIDSYLEKEIPVTLGSVRNKGLHLNPTANMSNHAVVVTGKDNDSYFINDPSSKTEGQYTIHSDRLLHVWYNSAAHLRAAWR